jgi:hypothetical protein
LQLPCIRLPYASLQGFQPKQRSIHEKDLYSLAAYHSGASGAVRNNRNGRWWRFAAAMSSKQALSTAPKLTDE